MYLVFKAQNRQLARKTVYYPFLVASHRIDGKVKQRSKAIGPEIPQWNMKEIVYLLTGTMPFNDEHKEKFIKENLQFTDTLQLLLTVWETRFSWSRSYTIQRYTKSVPCLSCVYDFVQEHGIPSTFKTIFQEHNILDNIQKWLMVWQDTKA